jgi:hypothetical protein
MPRHGMQKRGRGIGRVALIIMTHNREQQ